MNYEFVVRTPGYQTAKTKSPAARGKRRKPTASVHVGSIGGWSELGWLRQSDSGVSVTWNTAKTYSTVWQALQIISGDVARIKFNRYDVGPNDSRNLRKDLPAWRLLNGMASRFMHAYTLRETMTMHALLAGNAYAWIVRQPGTLTPTSLVLLDPRETEPVIVAETGDLVYESKQLGRFIDAADMFHLRGLGDNGIKGESVLDLARNSFGLGLAAEKHGNRTMKNGVRPSIVLTHPDTLTPEQAAELLDTFEARHAGAENNGRPALAAGGLGLETLPISNENAQWLESRGFQRVEIASWFCLPPHKVGDMSRSGYNSVEAEETSYVTQTLMRWFVRWEIEAATKLMTEADRLAGSYFEHNVDALIRGDMKTQFEVLTGYRKAKVLTKNEVRRKLNMAPVADGDTFENPDITPGNSAAPVPAATNSIDQQPFRDLVTSRVEQLTRTECAQLIQAAKSKTPAASIEKFYASFNLKFAEALAPLSVVISATFPELKTRVASLLSSLVDEIEADKTEILDCLTRGTPANMLAVEIEEQTRRWPETRAARFCAVIFGDESK